MLFNELRNLIRVESEKGEFNNAGAHIQEKVFNLNRISLIPLVTEIGAIPEDIAHDSSEEKLYAKVADIVLAKCFQELGFSSTTNKERANCADVIAKSRYHSYSLVGDAKAFRLSRTAKNQKDFKVKSMVDWKGDNDFAVLVCPYYQYPKSNSQIYGQALDGNVVLFSWENLSILLENSIIESSGLSLASIWNISELISKKTSVSDKNSAFLNTQNVLIQDFFKLDKVLFDNKFKVFRDSIKQRGNSEIDFWKKQIELIKSLSKDEAITKLLSSLKLNEKIASIKKYISSIGE